MKLPEKPDAKPPDTPTIKLPEKSFKTSELKEKEAPA